MKRFFVISSISLLLIFLLNITFQESSYARPGGGDSYSNSSNSSGHSSTTDSDHGVSGGGNMNPVLGLIIFIALFGAFFYHYKKERKNSKLISKANQVIKQRKIAEKNAVIEKFKATDSNFSKTLFLDFVAEIFNKFYSWVYQPEFKNLAPYLPAIQIEESKKLSGKAVFSEIVIGAINIIEIKEDKDKQKIIADIEANLTSVDSGLKKRHIGTERWVFYRDIGTSTPEPEKMRELSCPNCGAPVNFSDAGECASCKTIVDLGKNHWAVEKHWVLRQNSFKTNNLVSSAPEKGTNLPTIVHANINKSKEEFIKAHNLKWTEWSEKFNQEVISKYFMSIFGAWSENNLNSVRNLLSDRLFGSFLFWINEYKKKAIVNKLENIVISKIEYAAIELDKFYESVTVRVFASALDYKLNVSNGRVVSGSKRKPRKFSEYWTFIRRTGVEIDDYNYGNCPNCGSPADKIGQSGVCGYCDTKISNGDFSWVLAIITQDEVYKG